MLGVRAYKVPVGLGYLKEGKKPEARGVCSWGTEIGASGPRYLVVVLDVLGVPGASAEEYAANSTELHILVKYHLPHSSGTRETGQTGPPRYLALKAHCRAARGLWQVWLSEIASSRSGHPEPRTAPASSALEPLRPQGLAHSGIWMAWHGMAWHQGRGGECSARLVGRNVGESDR